MGTLNIQNCISEFYNRFLTYHSQKQKKRQYYFFYSLLFLISASLIFCWYFLTDRTFIWYRDGYSQHYKALVYYSNYIKTIIRELIFNHRFVFKEWDYSLGEGNDILQTLHYYVIGDPYAFFSFLIPTKYIYIYYDVMILFRLYCAGLAFSCLCFYLKQDLNRYAVLAGALIYAFCSWSIFNSARHPYFLNPMIYFPLVILGIEKILKGGQKKSYLLTIAVFLSAISNFYFFYQIVILTVIYVIVRLVVKYKKDIRSIISYLIPIAGRAILGVVMSSIILIPIIYDFLNDTRMGGANNWDIVYDLYYYSSFLGLIFSKSSSFGTSIGMAAPALPAIILLFITKKKNCTLKILFLICTVMLLIPACGQFLNGMSYKSNRWSWAFVLLSAFILTTMWADLFKIKFNQILKVVFILSIYLVLLLIFENSRIQSSFAGISLAFIFLLVLIPFKINNESDLIFWQRVKQVICLMIVIISDCTLSYFLNAQSATDYASSSMEIDELYENNNKSEAEAILNLDSNNTKSFYRYSGRSIKQNVGVLSQLSSTQYYWSLANPAVSDFRAQMELSEIPVYCSSEYDANASLLSLSSVLYYAVPKSDKNSLPYGFSYVDTIDIDSTDSEDIAGKILNEVGQDELSEEQTEIIEDYTETDYKIYRNDYALPLVYTYDNVISENTWNGLSAIEKQEAMLQAVYLQDYGGQVQNDSVNYENEIVDYDVECNSDDITLEDYGFVVTSEDSSVTINFDGIENSETYFVIRGLNYEEALEYDLYNGDEKYDPNDRYTKTDFELLNSSQKSKIKKSKLLNGKTKLIQIDLSTSAGDSTYFKYGTEEYSYYEDTHDYSIHLQYSEEALTSVTLTFNNIGIYSFDSIEIICLPMDNYENYISNLKEISFDNEVIGTDTITGSVSLEEEKILCFSVPYSIGWKAYVDGEEAAIYKANVKNMALVLEAGEHEIKLVYHTPYLKLGALVSLIGFVIFAIIIFNERHKAAKN